MTLAPATLLSVGCMLLNLIFLVLGAHNFTLFKKVFPVAMESIGFACVSFYLLMFSIGLLTVITEWKKILASPKKRLFRCSLSHYLCLHIFQFLLSLYSSVLSGNLSHTVFPNLWKKLNCSSNINNKRNGIQLI